MTNFGVAIPPENELGNAIKLGRIRRPLRCERCRSEHERRGIIQIINDPSPSSLSIACHAAADRHQPEDIMSATLTAPRGTTKPTDPVRRFNEHLDIATHDLSSENALLRKKIAELNRLVGVYRELLRAALDVAHDQERRLSLARELHQRNINEARRRRSQSMLASIKGRAA
jgi:hypothetical protein